MPLLNRNKSGRAFRRIWTAFAADHVVGLAWSADGRALAALTGPGELAWFDPADGREAGTVPAHARGGGALAFRPVAGGQLATAGLDGRVRLWDANACAPALELDAGGDWADVLAWKPDGSRLAAATGKVVRVWDAEGNLAREIAPLPSTVADLAWRPRAGHLTAACYGGAVLMDPELGDGKMIYPWKGSPLKLAWNADGRMLAHGNQDSTVHFWYADTLRDLQMAGYETKVRELSWDATGRFLATGGGPAACVWDCGKSPEGTTPQLLGGHAAPLAALAYQRKGHLLATLGGDGRLCVWQPANKKQALVGGDAVSLAAGSCLAWSADDRLVAAGAADGAVSVYQVG